MNADRSSIYLDGYISPRVMLDYFTH